ncbi:AAA family ATPase [Microcoleus vaginatus DQ-U2]|uniref:ATP-binding protein n=1 Tax=Microcoleus vaginatus TaxID=119532 RepID=UPI0016879621|nr:AAA family ATPase [Microcoleus sp. FACHB-DQ6]
MPQPTLKASQAGIEKAKTAQTGKGWSRQDLADRVVVGEGKHPQIGIGVGTVNNFFNCKGVKSQYFVGICKALGLNWEKIEEPNGTPSPQESLPNDNPIAELEQLNINHDNPFIPQHGKIDDPRFLFGREREIRWVFQTLNSGSSVAIIGERAIGKSSLLQAIYRQAPTQLHHPRQPIYLDLRNVCDEDDFYRALCDKAGIETAKGYQLQRALESHRFLLLLDQVEKMTSDEFTNQVRGQLRGLAEGNNAPLRLVVSARNPLDILFPDSEDKNMTSPFRGICVEETMKQWDEKISRKFIASRLQASWLTPVAQPVNFTEAEIAGLIAESGGSPQKLMQLCYQTYARYIN